LWSLACLGLFPPLQYHPDRISSTAGKTEAEQAVAIFNRATEAHSILGNAKQKAVYDKFGAVAPLSLLLISRA